MEPCILKAKAKADHDDWQFNHRYLPLLERMEGLARSR